MKYPTAISAVSSVIADVPHVSNLTWAYVSPVDAYLVEVGYKTWVEDSTEMEVTRAHTFDMKEGQYPDLLEWVGKVSFQDYLATLNANHEDEV
jgi:hypothetical protein